jgi:hypothetical protein
MVIDSGSFDGAGDEKAAEDEAEEVLIAEVGGLSADRGNNQATSAITVASSVAIPPAPVHQDAECHRDRDLVGRAGIGGPDEAPDDA